VEKQEKGSRWCTQISRGEETSTGGSGEDSSRRAAGRRGNDTASLEGKDEDINPRADKRSVGVVWDGVRGDGSP